MAQLDDCLKKGLLRKIPPSREEANNSLTTANRWLSEAEDCLRNNISKSSVLASYLAMFHAARAVLFLD